MNQASAWPAAGGTENFTILVTVRGCQTRAPLRAQRPKDFSVSRLPPRRQQHQKRRKSSYKDLWLIVAFQGAEMRICFGQGLSSDHVRPSRRRAFAITTSFLMIAVSATFPDFPARMSLSYFSLRPGLYRVATRAGM